MPPPWTVRDIPDLHGTTAIITGGNSGIGFHTALELGRAGATVTIACRNAGRGAAAIAQMQKSAPNASFGMELLDLASLASVRAFAGRWIAAGKSLDLLINNAAVMAVPQRTLTVDGFEQQFATNHLGHFALTGLLLPVIQQSRQPRVVVVASTAANIGRLDLANLQGERRYRPMLAYAQSKFANLAFMLELARRYPSLTVTGAHPGWTATNLQQHFLGSATALFGQPPSQGALPTLRASVDHVDSGTYFGPRDWFQMRGAPVAVPLPPQARARERHARLWEASERLTGVRYS